MIACSSFKMCRSRALLTTLRHPPASWFDFEYRKEEGEFIPLGFPVVFLSKIFLQLQDFFFVKQLLLNFELEKS